MAVFSGADWIVVIGAVGAAAAGVVGAWLAHRRPPEPSDEADAKAQAGIRLHEEDRTLVHKLIDVVSRGVTRIEDAIADHRRSLDNNSDELKRSRKD